MLARSNDGQIHLISAISTEYTLCGDAFEGVCMGSENNDSAWKYIKEGIIDCRDCLLEIENVQNYKN